MLSLSITHRDQLARAGQLSTAHGVIDTPNFMTVGTLGAPKGVMPAQIEELGAQVMLMNAFHLAWRPGEQIVKKLGGLHAFTGWKRPILTDSGGYQIFSLPGLRKITEEGAVFASAVDGTVRQFSPEAVVDIELALAPDMAMVLDECPPYPCSHDELSGAVERSIRWAQRSYAHAREALTLPSPTGRGETTDVNFFGIVQGGFDEALRQRSLEATAAIPFAGLALGGFCVGEPIEETHRGIVFTAPKMPADRPRYLMGMGTPADILLAVAHGIDLFDCTLPTRNGRNGLAFTSQGKIRIKNARHTQSDKPLDAACNCYCCRNFSRAFLRHLLLAREMNAAILTSLHNLAFYLNLMKEIRDAIKSARLSEYSKDFLARWNSGESDE
ncbi:MAG TPA: tRNA guanosine(34) transglycosylase Tgt [Planctomycetota bacterium]|nr:tRNA guanosine(34) transglycosylase Tgt [Planctomycetota bacterium]